MRNYFNAENILMRRGCSLFDTAMKIHDSYVRYNSDSMQNPSHPNYFTIKNILPVDDKFMVQIDQKGQELLSNPLSAEELVNVICGGKLTCGSNKFNTKEANFENRVAIATKCLAGLLSEEAIREKIANGIVKDNSSALIATHWLTQLENLHGFSEDDVIELLHNL